MGQLASWTLLLMSAGIVLSVELKDLKLPQGVDLRKIESLMRIVDPKSCGCARPDQHCEVPVPEAKFVGFTCNVGTFCCRLKKRPGKPELKTLEKLIPQAIKEQLDSGRTDFSQGLLLSEPQKTQQNRQQFTQTRQPTPRRVDPIIHQNPLRNNQQVSNPNRYQNKLSQQQSNIQGSTAWRPQAGRQPQATNPQPLYNPIEVKTMDDIEPHHLGLPEGVKAFIKPVSQLQHRILITSDNENEPKKNYKVCECEVIEDCLQENRDYITFRKSCPYGEVQCCRENDEVNLNQNGNPVSVPLTEQLEILSTTSKSYPVEINQNIQSFAPFSTISHIRPVNIPVSLVPEITEKPQSSQHLLQTDNTFVDQTFRKQEATDAVSLNETAPHKTTTQTPTTFTTASTVTNSYSATPYTIVSSSFSIQKIVWETVTDKPTKNGQSEITDETTQQMVMNEDEPAEMRAENVFHVHSVPVKNIPNQIPITNQVETESKFPTRNPILIQPSQSPHIIHTQPNRYPPIIRPGQQQPQNYPPRQIPGPYRGQQNRDPQPRPLPQYPYANPQYKTIRPSTWPGAQPAVPTKIQTVQHNIRASIRPNSQGQRPNYVYQGDQQPSLNPQQLPYLREPNNQNQVRPRPPTVVQTQQRPRQPARPIQAPYPGQPGGQLIDRSDLSQYSAPEREIGFVESVGDAAINLVSGIFSWPF